MSLAERLKTPPIQPSKQFCSVGRLLEELRNKDTREYVAVVTALGVPAWSASDIYRELEAENYQLSIRHIREHRNGMHSEQNCRHPEVGRL